MLKVWHLFDGRVLSSQIQPWICRLWAARLLPSSLELQTKFLTGGLRVEETSLCHLPSKKKKKTTGSFSFPFLFLWEKPCKIHYIHTAKDGNDFMNHIRFSFEFFSFFPERVASSAFDHLKPFHWCHLTKRLRSYLLGLYGIKDTTANFWSKWLLKITNTPPPLSGSRSACIVHSHVKPADEKCAILLHHTYSWTKCLNTEIDHF